MNERIRELHSQCKVSDEGKLLYFDYERFAELIVRECINATGNCAGTGNMIKEHFGVEE